MRLMKGFVILVLAPLYDGLVEVLCFRADYRDSLKWLREVWARE